jgi:tetratricopeptide (TPR) repeat protein
MSLLLDLPPELLRRILDNVTLRDLRYFKCAAKQAANHARSILSGDAFAAAKKMNSGRPWLSWDYPLPMNLVDTLVANWTDRALTKNGLHDGNWSARRTRKCTATDDAHNATTRVDEQAKIVRQIFSRVERYDILQNDITPIGADSLKRLKEAVANSYQDELPDGYDGSDDHRWAFRCTFRVRTSSGPAATFAFSICVEGRHRSCHSARGYDGVPMSNKFQLKFLGADGERFLPLFEAGFEQYQLEECGPYWARDDAVEVMASLLGLPESATVVRKRVDCAALPSADFCGWESEDDLLHALLDIAFCGTYLFTDKVWPTAKWSTAKWPTAKVASVELSAPQPLPPRPDECETRAEDYTWADGRAWPLYGWYSEDGFITNACFSIDKDYMPSFPYGDYGDGSGFGGDIYCDREPARSFMVGVDEASCKTLPQLAEQTAGSDDDDEDRKEHGYELVHATRFETIRVVNMLHQEGNAAFNRGNFESAKNAFKRAYLHDQYENVSGKMDIICCNLAAAFASLAVIDKLRRAQYLKPAEHYAWQALVFNKRFAEAYSRLAAVSLLQGNRQIASWAVSKLMHLDPDYQLPAALAALPRIPIIDSEDEESDSEDEESDIDSREMDRVEAEKMARLAAAEEAAFAWDFHNGSYLRGLASRYFKMKYLRGLPVCETEQANAAAAASRLAVLEGLLSHDQWSPVTGREELWMEVGDLLDATPMRSTLVVPEDMVQRRYSWAPKPCWVLVEEERERKRAKHNLDVDGV